MQNPLPVDLTLTNEIILNLYEEDSGLAHDVTEVLEPIATLFDACQAALISRPEARPPQSAVIRGRDATPEFQHLYVTTWYSLDPFVRLPQGRACLADEFIGEGRWLSGEFYRQFLRPQNVHHVLGADFRSSDGTVQSLRICRAADSERFSRKDLDVLEFLLPHLRKASNIHARQRGTRAASHLLEKTAEHMGVGLILLDQAGHVLQTNPIAQAHLQPGGALLVSNSRVRASNPSDNEKLKSAVTHALAASLAGKVCVTGAIGMTASSTEHSIGLVVRSLTAEPLCAGDRVPAVAIFMRDAFHDPQVSQPVLQSLFSLTRSEARLAMLLISGLTLDQAVQEASVSRNTLRTHLQSLFRKTGTTRQSDLLRALLGSVASIGLPANFI